MTGKLAIPVASPGFSARTTPATATEAAKLLRSDRGLSTVTGACAAMKPPRRGRFHRPVGPIQTLHRLWLLPVGRHGQRHRQRHLGHEI